MTNQVYNYTLYSIRLGPSKSPKELKNLQMTFVRLLLEKGKSIDPTFQLSGLVSRHRSTGRTCIISTGRLSPSLCSLRTVKRSGTEVGHKVKNDSGTRWNNKPMNSVFLKKKENSINLNPMVVSDSLKTDYVYSLHHRIST